jgi:hypothetical protein
MAEMVGSAGATLDLHGAHLAAIGEPAGASRDTARAARMDHDLAWQTTLGQIIFLEEVLQAPR